MGAIKLIKDMGGGTLCFGTEVGEKDDFLKLANVMLKETKEFKEALKINLAKGVPFAQAKVNALTLTEKNVNIDLLNNPNSILGIEYTKAILTQKANVEIMPIKRLGSEYNSQSLKGEFCSASAIRGAISRLKKKSIKKHVPSYVYADLPDTLPDVSKPLLTSLLKSSLSELREVTDCTEGLENRIKVVARSVGSFSELIDRLETKRYTRARLQRIVTSCMLGIKSSLIQKSLKGDSYLKVLAINKDKMDILSYLNKTINAKTTKLLTRKSDVDSLDGNLLKAFEIDALSGDIYHLVTGEKTNEFEMKIIERENK